MLKSTLALKNGAGFTVVGGYAIEKDRMDTMPQQIGP